MRLSLAAWLLYGLMRLLIATLRIRYVNLEVLTSKQMLCATWHSELFLTPYLYRKLYPNKKATALISSHKDGDVLARLLSIMGVKSVRGSTRKGAQRALFGSLKALKEGRDLMVTPDGPKGPRYSVNEGIIFMAQSQALDIYLLNYKASSYWQLSSWDRFVIPKPFSRVEVFAKRVDVKDLSLEDGTQRLKEVMVRDAIA